MSQPPSLISPEKIARIERGIGRVVLCVFAIIVAIIVGLVASVGLFVAMTLVFSEARS